MTNSKNSSNTSTMNCAEQEIGKINKKEDMSMSKNNIFEQQNKAAQEAMKRVRAAEEHQREEQRIEAIAKDQLEKKARLIDGITPNTIVETMEAVKNNEFHTLATDIDDIQFTNYDGKPIQLPAYMRKRLETLYNASIRSGDYEESLFTYRGNDCLAIGIVNAETGSDVSLAKDIERIKVAIVRGDVILPRINTILGPVVMSGYYMVKLANCGLTYHGMDIPSIIVGRDAEECARDEIKARVAAAQLKGRTTDVNTVEQLIEAGIIPVDEYEKDGFRYAVTDDHRALALPGEDPDKLDGACVANLDDMKVPKGTDQKLITSALMGRTPERALPEEPEYDEDDLDDICDDDDDDDDMSYDETLAQFLEQYKKQPHFFNGQYIKEARCGYYDGYHGYRYNLKYNRIDSSFGGPGAIASAYLQGYRAGRNDAGLPETL